MAIYSGDTYKGCSKSSKPQTERRAITEHF